MLIAQDIGARLNNMPRRKSGVLRVLTSVIATAVTVFALDAFVFRSGIYTLAMAPDSAAGTVENLIRDERLRHVSDRNQILAVGHSRMHLMPRIANELKGSTGYTFASISIGGSTPRSWYYMLRDVDPTAHRYAAILIPVEDYDDPDPIGDHANWPLDVNYIIGRFRLTDICEFGRSIPDPQVRSDAYRALILKGLVYKRDFQEFLRNPSKRLTAAALARKDGASWLYGYVGPKDSLKGLSIDWTTRTAHYPADFPRNKLEMIHNVLLAQRPPQTGLLTKYQRYWFGRIREHYRGSGTRLIFLRVARGPVVRPDAIRLNPHSSVRELAGKPGTIILNEHLFDELERPELFTDAQHLNWEGTVRFSHILAREVRRQLGPPGTSY